MGIKARRESTPNNNVAAPCSLLAQRPCCCAVFCRAVLLLLCCSVSVLYRFFCMLLIGRVLWAKKGSVQEETARLAAEVCAAGSPPSEVGDTRQPNVTQHDNDVSQQRHST